MKSNNINQICQKLLKNLSVVGLSLGVFNTITNLNTIKSLKNYLEIEKDKNQQLTTEINNLVCENISNNKI